MRIRKSYGQFCGLACSLDHVGDRWTLLVIRELLLGDRTFRELEEALAGVSPSLLANRLSQLTDDDLVVRNDAPPRSKRVEYRLTEAGRSLEAVIVELIRWGTIWMLEGPGADRVDARWAPLALKALLDGDVAAGGCIHLDVEGVPVTIGAAAGRRRVTAGHDGQPGAMVAASLPILLAVATNFVPLRSSGAAVSGKAELAAALLAATTGDS